MRLTIRSPAGRQIFADEVPQLICLGRQDVDAQEPNAVAIHAPSKPGEPPKLIFAAESEYTVSRNQLLLEQRQNQIVAKNVSSMTTVDLRSAPAADLPPGTDCIRSLPVTLQVAGYQILVTAGGPDDEASYEMLEEVMAVPGQPLVTRRLHDHRTAELGSLRSSFKGEAHEALLKQLENVIQVLQQPATSDQFLRDLVQTAVMEIELDEAAVLMRADSQWRVSAQAGRNLMTVEGWQPAIALLTRMTEKRRGFRRPNAFEAIAGTEHVVTSMMAVPILSANGEVIGALYGHRYAPGAHISRMDVRLVKLLATGAAAALVRIEQERKIIKTTALFEQFVTPKIARHITANPKVLAGDEAEASLLFCDIAGFSRITERLNPAQTIAWINDVLEAMSQCVLQEEGTLVDYVGDELFAMFGAPLPQKDHAIRACRAGSNMLVALEQINSKWSNQLQEKMGLGIGINSGRVLVGNVGSSTKLKFGAHGTPVNIASRVQSATRYIGIPFLVTESTIGGLGQTFETRRICQVRVKNIKQPICLYEVSSNVSNDWKELKSQYEQALTAWEQGKIEHTFRLLGRLAADFPHDGPTLALLKRSMEATQSGRPPEIVWELPGK